MPWLPGWNSVEGTTRGENLCFWAGIVCLILLAFFEIMSRVYSTRKDVLIEAAQRARIAEEQDKQKQAEERHAAEIEALKRGYTDHAERLQAQGKSLAERRLSQEQRE